MLDLQDTRICLGAMHRARSRHRHHARCAFDLSGLREAPTDVMPDDDESKKRPARPAQVRRELKGLKELPVAAWSNHRSAFQSGRGRPSKPCVSHLPPGAGLLMRAACHLPAHRPASCLAMSPDLIKERQAAAPLRCSIPRKGERHPCRGILALGVRVRERIGTRLIAT